jgi:hypothetical protein
MQFLCVSNHAEPLISGGVVEPGEEFELDNQAAYNVQTRQQVQAGSFVPYDDYDPDAYDKAQEKAAKKAAQTTEGGDGK